MTFASKIRVNALFLELAQKRGVSPAAVRKEIQKAIDEAWECQDPGVRWKQLQLFPTGKPTPEQFIAQVARQT